MDALEGTAVRYVLAPWPEHSAIRVIVTYDADTEARRIAERAATQTTVRARPAVLLLSPLLGHLPAALQKEVEARYAVSAVLMTIASAAPLFLLGAAGGVSAIARVAGAPPLYPWLPGPLISAYLALESSLRLYQAWAQSEPMGSLPGLLLGGVARAALDIPPAPAPPPTSGAAAASVSQTAGDPATAAGDEVPESESPPDDPPGRDRFLILEPLWSLLTVAEQDFLFHRYGFEALRWGRVTAATLFVVGIANALASLASIAAGVAGLIDALWLAGGLALCVEQAARWRANRRGDLRGSVLGWIVRPLARPLLSPRPN
ncbi:MAG: hypothetical protein ABI592_08915 [Acidobacteriota bacterium]